MGFPRQEYWSGLPFPSPMHESENWKWSLSVVSDSQWPHGPQPTRLLCPWNFPGKSTGVSCHCLLQNEALQQLIEFFHENALVMANTLFQQHKRRLYTWTSPDGQHWNQIDYILCSQRWRSSIQSAKTRPGADCGSDHEFLIAKLRLKLKKVGKTTRPLRFDLNQIPNNYTVEVRNRFKRLDLIESLMNYKRRLVTLHRRQGSRPSPWKRNAKRQNGCLRRPYK